MKLAVIIVSYNTRDLLRNCLRTVFASAERLGRQSIDNHHVSQTCQVGRQRDLESRISATCPPDRSHHPGNLYRRNNDQDQSINVEVTIVDSASHDNSVDMVHNEFPQAHLIASDENLGFTRGNNLALKHLGFTLDTQPPNHLVTQSSCHPAILSPGLPDYVLLLNPDTELHEDTLQQMLGFMQRSPQVGACGAHLTYGNGHFQHGAFHMPNLFQVALDLFPLTGLPGLHRLLNSRLNGRYPSSLWQGKQPFAVDFVLGAAMMVRGKAIQQVGGLDEGFFMYCEELDWCLRLSEAGWPVYAVPTAYVTHYEGQSSRQIRWSAYVWLWRSRFRFYQRHRYRYPKGYLTLLRGLVKVGLRIRNQLVHRRFAKGEVTGTEATEELAAYQKIASIWS